VKRRQRRKAIALGVLLALLALLGAWYVNFQATKSLTLDLRAPAADSLDPPVYMFSFTGTGANHLQQPIGVLATDTVVYVTDSRIGQVDVFSQDGKFLRAFGKNDLVTPLFLAKSPKDGNIYIADRRKRAILIFTPAGKYVGLFDPKLPKAELPTFKTGGVQWAPVALDFAPDGSMYVLEILNGHRMLQFAPDGSFVRSIGGSGTASTSDPAEGKFQFPNSVKVFNGEVYVADSNNRRIEVFDLQGVFKRTIRTLGLPRGIAFLPRPAGAAASTSDKFVVVDTLSHDASIYSTQGKKVVGFGERGVLDGQFDYPNDASVGNKSVVFITDTQNARVQAWGWPQNVSPLPKVLPRSPWWLLALLPLPFLPLFFRKKRFFATEDFVEAVIANGELDTMFDRRRAWFMTAAGYEAIKGRVEGTHRLGDELEATEYSDTDARSLVERMAIGMDMAAVLVAAKRTRALCTEDPELRRMANLLEIDVYSAAEFAKKFAKPGASGGTGHAE
jgi:DNA-binding beta-propeller fold protein YncE